MRLIILLLVLCVFILMGYIWSLHSSLQRIYRDIQRKKIQDSNTQLMNPSQHRSLDCLIDEYNDLFQQRKGIRLQFQRERKILEQTLHNVSHDIRTPLTVSSGIVKQLLKKEPDQESLLKVQEALQNISIRLEELLEFQNLLEHNVKAEWEQVDLSHLLTEQLFTFYDLLTREHFEVEIDIEERIVFTSDSDLINRILQNVIGNVLKHGEKRLEVKLKREAEWIELRVINQSKQTIKHIEKLTQRFYTEDMSVSEKSSGLGLYITQELVEMTGGYLFLEYVKDCFIVVIQWPNL
ncbi:HAMP domain-containing histidine kinase [Facklamia sp. DSM 111018]|uniref:histidine kinase n=1 Tax=Facklamia lactis TaxID=2749967 RepID=A0ABS0LPS1_9LACT|nr:HAMP domain-containing sensor histidine kinase [Facklamia lactis]MBG9986148.1 HAMP domain-containing histidine kinase [Facklamia lactis]